jgi:alkylhydroperoxidase/carboxymuconolactone decarboxylase family protein YurZ
MADVTKETSNRLESLATAEEEVISSLLAMQLHNLEESGFDPRTYSLIKLATLIAIDAPPASYVAQVAFAIEAGVTPEEIVNVLVAVAPQVGIPKVVAAAPELMVALGLELEAASA